MKDERTKTKKGFTGKAIFLPCAVFSIFAVFAIIFYIFYASFPAFREIGIFNFLFGKLWAPDKDFLEVTEKFGILPMIVSSLCVTLGAIIFGGAGGILAAVFLSKFCPKRVRGLFSQVINFLAGIPSIIYGFFGMVVIVPLLAKISPTDSGFGILACSIILGIMILPTVTSITKNSIEAVPKSYFEGAVALGASPEQALFKIVLPAAKSGISTGLILGIGRAIGETMAVMMVAGNAARFPEGLFSNIRTLTINMVLEMGYAAGLHKQALIASGAVLLVFILLLNILLGVIKRNKRERKNTPNKDIDSLTSAVPALSVSGHNTAPIYKKCGGFSKLLKCISVAVSSAILLILAAIIGFILVQGIPHISANLLFGKSGNAGMTLRPAFVTTGLLILIALAIALPIGIGAAIYLAEYSKKNSRFVKIIRLFTETLSGIPSIVFGFFGMIFFCEIMGLGYSILAGGLTLSLIILPTIIRSTEESIIAVQDSLREASLALGAGKLRTIFKIVLPSALSGIVTSVILSIGRIVGESAALIYTAGAVSYMPRSIMDPGSSFAVMMYMFASEGLYMNEAYATAAVLLIVVALLNGLVLLFQRKLSKGKTQ